MTKALPSNFFLSGSGYPDKYLYEICHEYLSGRGRLSGKIISIKRYH